MNSNKKVSALVEWIRQWAHNGKVICLIPPRMELCVLMLDGCNWKYLGAEAYYYVTIYAPMTRLILNRLQKFRWSDVKQSFEQKKV